jgi:Tfp pilus assembly major pilin PilA
MKTRQQGVSLSGLLGGAFVVAILALLGMKVFPEYLEHRAVASAVKKVASGAAPESSVRQIRDAFDRQANVDYITAINGADLEITKEAGAIVVSYSYEKRIPLVANVSLLLDFTGSSRD